MENRYFVITVCSSDEYDDFVTHVAVALRPSAIARLILVDRVSRLVRALIGWLCFYQLEVSFQETTWLDFNPVDEDFPEDWDEGAVEERIDPDLINEHGLIGRSVKVTGDGWLIFSCCHKHSGTEFASNEVALRDLVRAIRLSDVAAELRQRFGKNHLAGGSPCVSQS